MKRITAIILALLMVMTVAAGAMGEENKIWKTGDTGEKVTWIQTRLKELEYLEEEPTGAFDEETEKALKEFQQDYNLLQTGMADSVTMEVLETAARKKTELRAWLYTDFYEEEATAEYAYDGKFAVNSMPMSTSMPMQAAGAAWKNSVDWNTEEYTTFESNRFLSVLTSPLSTFAADVDTSSYALFRRKVLSGERVALDSIRIEEMLNSIRNRRLANRSVWRQKSHRAPGTKRRSSCWSACRRRKSGRTTVPDTTWCS